MTWLNLWFALQVGLLPGAAYRLYDTSIANVVHTEIASYDWMLHTSMEVEIEAWKIVFLHSRVGFYADPELSTLSFNPHSVQFDFTAGIRLGVFELGFKHICMHPIISTYNPFTIEMTADGFSREIYARLELGKR